MNLYYLGHHEFDPDTNILYFNRNCGIGSNVTVLMHFLMDLKLKGIYPENIKTKLTDYKDIDMYEENFYIDKNNLIKWRDFSNSEIEAFMQKAKPSELGLGTCKEEINLHITNLLLTTFFNFTKKVYDESNEIIKKYNIKDYNFIFWRKSDKIGEIKDGYPDLCDGLSILKTKLNLIAQTDDYSIFEELKQFNDITILNELPLSKTFNHGVHYMCKDMTNEEYKQKYGHDYKDHITKLLAIIYIASKSKIFVGYPGNLSFLVAVLRNSFENVYFFKNKNSLY